jgi:hypothetical protein
VQLKYRHKKWCVVATGFDCNNCLLLQLPPQAAHHVMALPLIASSNQQEMFQKLQKQELTLYSNTWFPQNVGQNKLCIVP